MYVENCIIFIPQIRNIDGVIQLLKDVNRDFILTDKEDIKKFLGIKKTHLDEKPLNISQPFLINRIISLLNIDIKTYGMGANTKSTPVGKPLLNKDLKGKPRKGNWKYQTAVGMLTYLRRILFHKCPCQCTRLLVFQKIPCLHMKRKSSE